MSPDLPPPPKVTLTPLHTALMPANCEAPTLAPAPYNVHLLHPRRRKHVIAVMFTHGTKSALQYIRLKNVKLFPSSISHGSP